MSFNLNSLNGKSAAGSTVYDGKRFQQTDQATGLFKVHSEPHRLTNLHSMPSPLVHTTYLTHSHTQPKLGTPFATTHNTIGQKSARESLRVDSNQAITASTIGEAFLINKNCN